MIKARKGSANVQFRRQRGNEQGYDLKHKSLNQRILDSDYTALLLDSDPRLIIGCFAPLAKPGSY